MSGLPRGPLDDLVDAHADRPNVGILHGFVGSLSALVVIDPGMPVADAVAAAVATALKVTRTGGDF